MVKCTNKERREEEFTWVVGLAVDVFINTPTSETKYNKVHNQIQEQQWCCYVPSDRRHHFSMSSFPPLFNSSDLYFFATLIQQKLYLFGDDRLIGYVTYIVYIHKA